MSYALVSAVYSTAGAGTGAMVPVMMVPPGSFFASAAGASAAGATAAGATAAGAAAAAAAAGAAVGAVSVAGFRYAKDYYRTWLSRWWSPQIWRVGSRVWVRDKRQVYGPLIITATNSKGEYQLREPRVSTTLQESSSALCEEVARKTKQESLIRNAEHLGSSSPADIEHAKAEEIVAQGDWATRFDELRAWEKGKELYQNGRWFPGRHLFDRP
ncbi:hypothetical protein LTR17_009876 [Elasticomyces elasticus]|nr:hypothetical protein LTR17_009876 [Elasticomyces elasticus]